MAWLVLYSFYKRFYERMTFIIIFIILGMGDTCCFPWSMGSIKRLIERELPGIYVYSVMVGNNIVEDEIAGFLGDVNDQIAQIAGKFNDDTNLSRGFNAVGFSQVCTLL